MPSFQDSALIFFIALLLFGPKKLPELARQLGKLMGEFRRASNEFRMQMEDELRIADQEEQQKKIAAMEAAAPVPPALSEAASPADFIPEPEHPHMSSSEEELDAMEDSESHGGTAPLPIATAGELSIMPPETGLPAGRSALTPMIEAIPRDESPDSSDGHVCLQQLPGREAQHDNSTEAAEVHLNG